MTGNVWIASDGKLYMGRCPKCGMENYVMAVAHGECAWCGYIAVPEDVGK